MAQRRVRCPEALNQLRGTKHKGRCNDEGVPWQLV